MSTYLLEIGTEELPADLAESVISQLELNVNNDLNSSQIKFNEIRKRLSCGDRTYNPCNVCDVNGLLNGEKAFHRWQKFLQK